MLSTISLIYDPLGLASSFLLPCRRILRQCCLDELDGEPLSEIKSQWEKWKHQLLRLKEISLQKCLPANFGKVISVSLHHFSGASLHDCGQCSHIRTVNEQGEIICLLIVGKSRVVLSVT